MKKKQTKSSSIELYLDLSQSDIQDIRAKVCEEYGQRELNNPHWGWQYNSKECQQCTLWSTCSMLGYMSMEKKYNKKVKEDLNIDLFFSESQVMEKTEDLVTKIIDAIQSKIDSRGYVEEAKLMKLLKKCAKKTLKTLDPEIPNGLKYQILNKGGFKLTNGRITK